MILLQREPQLTFKRSSFCSLGACVEVAVDRDNSVVVRDSRVADREVRFTAGEWRAFVAGVKAGEFDLPGE